MAISGTRAVGKNYTDLAVDANTASTTTILPMGNAQYASLFVIAASGAHTTHVITIQISGDGTNWEDTSLTITGTGKIIGVLCITAFIRAKVTTPEGGASTVDIILVIK